MLHLSSLFPVDCSVVFQASQALGKNVLLLLEVPVKIRTAIAYDLPHSLEDDGPLRIHLEQVVQFVIQTEIGKL